MTTPPKKTRINTAERVAVELRRSIRYGDLLPGEHVRQEEWAERLGVSRVPVREALKILAAEGLLLHDPHRGHFVAKMADDDMAQIYRMRTLLEPEVLRSVARPSPDELSTLRSQIKGVSGAMAAGNIAEALEIDRDFHFFIYNLSPLGFIVEEVKRLWSMCDSYRTSWMRTLRRSDPEASGLMHWQTEIVDALRRHDRDRLVEIVLIQRLETLQVLSGTWDGSEAAKPDYVVVPSSGRPVSVGTSTSRSSSRSTR